jgi:hypothetical protein
MAGRTVRTKDRFELGLAADGAVASAALGGRKLPLAGPGGFSVVESLAPDGQLRDHGRFTGAAKVAGGRLRFTGAIPQAALELSAEFRGGDFIDVRGEIRDTSGADRALAVTFTLPLELAGWRWENTAACARTLRPGRTEPSEPTDFLYLGKKGDGFANEDPTNYGIRISKLPFNAVVKGGLGLAMAYPLHEPRVFLLSASAAGLTITFSLGVTPITRKFPSRASFRFILFPVDAAWGIRSASERYMGFFPELFRTKARRHGNTGTISDPTKRPPDPHLADYGYAYSENDYQWTGGEISRPALELARSVGIGPREIFHWRGPWYWFNEAPGDITRDAQLASMKAQAEGRIPATAHGINNQLCGCPHELSAKAAYNSYLEDHQGKLERINFEYPSYSCWLLPLNLDPNLPKPNRGGLATEWQYRYVKLWKKPGFRGPFGIAYDAFDDFSGFRRLNFRRAHLAVMDTPATFDPASGRVCQVKGFHDWAWVRVQSGIARRAGGLVMANVNLEHSMMFGGQFIDVIDRERRMEDYDEERLSTHRMLLGAKPVAFPGGGWAPKDRGEWLRQARKVLAFGMSPGATGERREEIKALMPAVRRVAEAGWRPVPHARAKGLWIERFGDRPGRLFFAVRNCAKKPLASRLEIDLAGLGLAGAAGRLVLRQISPERPVSFAQSGRNLAGRIAVPSRETLVLELVKR